MAASPDTMRTRETDVSPKDRVNILLVDPDSRWTIVTKRRIKLEVPHAAVSSCSNSGEAMNLIRQGIQIKKPFDYVLANNPPSGERNGFVIAQAVREEKLPVRVGLLTGSAREVRQQEQDKLRKLGIRDEDIYSKPHLEKGWAKELVARIEQAKDQAQVT